MAWARLPRSALAMSVVFEQARRGDPRFSDIAATLVADGRATDAGVALQTWDGASWIKA
ncbi:MAG TPA: hypothetical protein VLG93_08540 [Sulfuricaulis sp.]|nr:hypothetical protein [Sulfuricaulis sp.]